MQKINSLINEIKNTTGKSLVEIATLTQMDEGKLEAYLYIVNIAK